VLSVFSSTAAAAAADAVAEGAGAEVAEPGTDVEVAAEVAEGADDAVGVDELQAAASKTRPAAAAMVTIRRPISTFITLSFS
jgi:hypothetical protein